MTHEEREELVGKLKDGYEQKLYWDPINTNTNGGFRVVQKGGKILTDIGEFGNSSEANNSKNMTLTLLKKRRKGSFYINLS